MARVRFTTFARHDGKFKIYKAVAGINLLFVGIGGAIGECPFCQRGVDRYAFSPALKRVHGWLGLSLR